MKFLGLRIWISILKLISFFLIVPCVGLICWGILGPSEGEIRGYVDRYPAVVAVAIATIVSVLLGGLLILALAQLLEMGIYIEKNTANIAKSTARIADNTSGALKVTVVRKRVDVPNESPHPAETRKPSLFRRWRGRSDSAPLNIAGESPSSKSSTL